ncbi:MAG TPA: OmpA family protein [Rhizomicrobium sp.]|nr:OmpA family protein [Rhizomicrobium sp.]
MARILRQGILAAAVLASLTATADANRVTLKLHPGLKLVCSIYGGYDKSGKALGDYDSVNLVTQVANGGYTYQFGFSGKSLSTSGGTQTVYPDDNAHGTMLREYWPSGDDSRKGDVSYLKLSDATYAAIKAGKETKLEMDDAENPVSIRKIGEEDLTTLINEKPTKVHTIKVAGKTKGTFWILDDPDLPMLIRGETKWKWMYTSISDGAAGADVVAALKSSGEATTHAILFATNSADFGSDAKPVLDAVAQYMKASPAVALEIQGHTDSIGGAASNLQLSQKRAEAVKAYLVSAGVDAKRLTAKGFGLTVPVADNKTPEGRARNRRVVFATKT